MSSKFLWIQWDSTDMDETLPHWSFWKSVFSGEIKKTFEHLQKLYWFAKLAKKGEDYTCKIDGFMAIFIPKLKWAWQVWFLSLTLLILKINTTFEHDTYSNDIKMIFWFLYWFQIFKDQYGSVPSISVLQRFQSVYV